MGTQSEIVTNVLVPGRGHDVGPNYELVLSLSSRQRVEAAVGYYKLHRDAFDTQDGLILFEGGWAEGAMGMEKPPEDEREGSLMLDHAVSLGLPKRHGARGIYSRTSMENMLEAHDVYGGVGRLAIVSQVAPEDHPEAVSHADRFEFCAERVFPNTEISIIPAPGETDPQVALDEERLLKQSKVLFMFAGHNHTLLRFFDRLGVFMGKVLHARPGDTYSGSLYHDGGMA